MTFHLASEYLPGVYRYEMRVKGAHTLRHVKVDFLHERPIVEMEHHSRITYLDHRSLILSQAALKAGRVLGLSLFKQLHNIECPSPYA